MDKISIVTVCYNCESVIENTLNSIVDQTYSNKELIVVDGASKDSTYSYVQKVSNLISMKSVSEPDKGVFDAMNKAAKLCSGDWIIFMNAGDVFYDKFVLDKVFKDKTYDKSIGVVFGDVLYKGNKMVTTQNLPFYLNNSKIKQMGICHQTIFTRTKLVENIGFDLNYKLASDYNMMHIIFLNGIKFKHVNVPIAIYDTSGISSSNPFRQLKEIAMLLGYYKTLYYYLYYLLLLKRTVFSKIKKLIR